MVNSLANSENPRIIQALLKTYALLAEEFNVKKLFITFKFKILYYFEFII